MGQSESSRKHYQKNRVVRRAEIKRRMQSAVHFVQGYKAASSCSRCNESTPCCLDFHHRDPEVKIAEVAIMARRGFSVLNILVEIEKCDVLCANCHRKEHFGRLVSTGNTPRLHRGVAGPNPALSTKFLRR